MTLDDIRHFRQLDSKAPGHPEYHWVSGVETTTGPLGQGVATSVGMAIAQKWLANRYNRPGFEIFDYNIYAVCGDGCLMEGVASEAASLAGHLGLDNLCWIYDNNHITIEGNTSITFTEDVAARFLGLRLERPAGRRRQRHRAHRACAGGLPQDQGPADVHHPGQPHRLRLAAQAGHRRGPRRAAGRRGGPPDQARLRLAGGREVPRARRRLRALRSRHRRARRRGAAQVEGAVRPPTARNIRSSRPRSTRCSGASCPPDGTATCRFSGRCEGHRRPRRLGQGAERARAEHSLVPRRLGRSRAVEQDHAEIRGRRRLSRPTTPAARTSISASASTRWPRSSTGCRSRSCGAFGATFFIFSDYARPAIRLSALMELPTHLRLHPRRHGRRRGRTDPSAGRAAGLAARHSRPGRAAARRRQRGRRGLSLHHAAAPPAGGARAVAPAAADARSQQVRVRRPASRAAPTCWPTRRAATRR